MSSDKFMEVLCFSRSLKSNFSSDFDIGTPPLPDRPFLCEEICLTFDQIRGLLERWAPIAFSERFAKTRPGGPSFGRFAIGAPSIATRLVRFPNHVEVGRVNNFLLLPSS